MVYLDSSDAPGMKVFLGSSAFLDKLASLDSTLDICWDCADREYRGGGLDDVPDGCDDGGCMAFSLSSLLWLLWW